MRSLSLAMRPGLQVHRSLSASKNIPSVTILVIPPLNIGKKGKITSTLKNQILEKAEPEKKCQASFSYKHQFKILKKTLPIILDTFNI